MLMTKTEARKILKAHNEWRRGGDGDMESPKLLSQAMDTLCEPPTISQALRDAAVNLPSFLSEEICGCVYAFLGHAWTPIGERDTSAFWRGLQSKDKLQSLTFMLIFAEALE